MNSTDETIIGLSRVKLALFALGAGAFVAVGVLFLFAGGDVVRGGRSYAYFFNDAWVVRGVGLAAVLLFGACGLYALKKMFDTAPALVLNASGFFDNASGVAAGFIPWSEVVGVGVFEVNKQKMLVIQVRDPRKYVERGGTLRRALNKANYKVSGGPVTIPANVLDIKFAELVSLFERYRRKYAGVTPAPEDDPASEAPFDDYAGLDGGSGGWAAASDTQLLNWSPAAVKGTMGAGGIAILVLSFSSLDLLFKIQPPFWVGFVASLLPALVFFFAVPDILPARFIRPAQWFAIVWYLVSSALSISLAAMRGMAGVDLLLVGFVLLGAWPCVLAIRRLRVAGAV